MQRDNPYHNDSTGGTLCKVRVGDKTANFTLKPGQTFTVNGDLKSL